MNPIAVYLPLADLYAKFGAGGLHIDEEMERHLGSELVLGLRRAGYDFDFNNDDALKRIARVENGRLVAGTGIYSAVIVPEARYIPPESLDPLVAFVKSRGFMIFVKQAPEAAPGLEDHESRTRRVERPGGARRMLVLGSEAAHRREAGEDQRHDARLGAAREHGVGGAALDHLGGLADGVRAGRARGDDGVVRAGDAERDRELA